MNGENPAAPDRLPAMQKPDISLAAAAGKLRQLTGETVRLVPITEGEDSRAFRYNLGNERFVLRINRSADGFAKDAYASRHFSAPALPIPAVVAHGVLDDGNGFCISHMAEGVTLQDLPPQDLPPVLAPVANVLQAIAVSDIGSARGYGPFDASGNGRNASWTEFLSAVSAYDWGSVTGDDQVADMAGRCAELARHCPDVRALVHADFGSNNVLTDGRRITGVIDWSEAMYGDPLYDIANILFWRPWLDCMEQQARYFEVHRPDLVRDKTVLACYQLRIGLQQVHESAVDGALDDMHWALQRCRAIDSLLRTA
mgnify:CR=1 FL=1